MPRLLASCLALLAVTVPCASQGWPNSGGNAQRNGQSTAHGPLSPQVAWNVKRSSRFSQQPIIDGDRVFLVRVSSFPPGPEDSPVFCYDLQTGAELWRIDIPFRAGEWTTHVLGTSNGLVYTSRTSCCGSTAKVHALDQTTGATIWISEDVIEQSSVDGVVFAPNGDLIVGWQSALRRIRAADGSTAWSAPRRCSSSTGSCGAALFGNAVYVTEGYWIKRFNLETGTLQYQGTSPFSSVTIQQTPMVGPDGTVYINHYLGPGIYKLLAWEDTGRGFELKWNVFSARVPFSEYGIGIDGSVYMLQRNLVLAALNPANGVLRATYPRPFGYNNMRCTVDADGRLYVSDGGFPTGRLYSFNPDLTLRWSLPFEKLGQGGPALGHDGTLVICDTNVVLGLRTPSPWTAVAGSISGVTGSPALLGRGTMTSGNDIVLSLTNARPGAASTLLVGGSALGLPLLGGTLVPSPQLVVSGLPIGARGSLGVTLTWPPGVPAGSGLWFQHWYLDPAAVQGVAASNGLRGITP